MVKFNNTVYMLRNNWKLLFEGNKVKIKFVLKKNRLCPPDFYKVITGSIIGDSDHKRAPFLLLGLSI